MLKGGKDIVERMVAPVVSKGKYFQTPFKDLTLKKCSPSEVESLQYRLKDRKTLANDVLRVISIVFSWGYAQGKYKGVNPVLSMVKYRNNKIRVKLSDLEVKQLMETCEGKPFDYDPRFNGLVTLSIRIGK